MQRKPNIILINADDLGYGDLGCYGSTVNDTPHLDRMAAGGLRLTDFYQASPVCSPSRAAMMTGCYPPRVGINKVLFPGEAIGLHPDEVTIAKMLKGAGYATMHIGKWHCGDQPEFLPTSHGFDHYYGIPYSNDMGRQDAKDGKVWPAFENIPPLPLLLDEEVIEAQPDQATLTGRYTEQAIRFIRAHQDGPFFLYLAHFHVHLPHYAPERFMKESRNGRFGGSLACMDWSCGVILHELSRLGIDKDTLVIFTSDNGARITEGGSNAPLRGAKASTWEGGMRVPCILYQPGTIQPGVCDGLATGMDFLPTFASLSGAPLPQGSTLDGVDMAPLLTGGQSNRDTFFYYMKDWLCAVRHGPWKLHVRHKKAGTWLETEPVQELYNLNDDIGETVNMYEDHPDVVERLLSLLAECRAELGDGTTGIEGTGVRPVGRVENPAPLTQFDPEHPYYIASYDLTERG
jgi:arylsulfatase A-like enzyme